MTDDLSPAGFDYMKYVITVTGVVGNKSDSASFELTLLNPCTWPSEVWIDGDPFIAPGITLEY